MTSDEAYRAGMVDEIQGNTPLNDVLTAAGEWELVLAYASGQLVGAQLIYDEANDVA